MLRSLETLNDSRFVQSVVWEPDLVLAVPLQLRHLSFQVRHTGLQLGRAHEGVSLVAASKLDLQAATLLVSGLLSSVGCSQPLRQLVMFETRQLQLLHTCCMFSLSAEVDSLSEVL